MAVTRVNLKIRLTATVLWLALAVPFGIRAQPLGSTNDPSITQQPQSIAGTLGGSATFAVTARGTQPLSYQWDLNGSAITNATTSSLTISNIQFSDAGSYFVIVTNSVGSVESTQVPGAV